jgi:hypothetical protein
VLGGLPVVAGPILLVETLLHGRDFGSDAAAGTLLGLAALTAFVVVYGRRATGASVLAVFTHAHGGAAQVNLLLRNFLVGFYGFASFCFVLAVALPSLSTPAAFGLATAVALVVQATIFYLRASRPVRAL